MTAGTISWRRRKSGLIDELENGSTTEASNDNGNGGDSLNGGNGKIRQQTSEENRSLLVIYNATLDDSGSLFDCVAFNGIGERATATASLVVRRE